MKKRKNKNERRGGYRPGSGAKATGNAKKTHSVGIRPNDHILIIKQFGTVQKWADANLPRLLQQPAKPTGNG